MRTVTIVMPCYEDGESLALLLPRIETALSGRDLRTEVVIVNDTARKDPLLDELGERHGARILTVPFNMGHQEAIVFGLRYATLHRDPDPEIDGAGHVFVTMDSDGQDAPESIPDLLEAVRPGRVVVAKRAGKRPEGLRFSLLHRVYKLMFRMLAGFTPDYGNFAAYDEEMARQVALSPHFDIAYSLSLPLIGTVERVPIARLPRLVGESKVRMGGLIDHSLTLLLPHWKSIVRRVSLASLVLGGISLCAALTSSVIRLVAPQHAFPNWATTIVLGSAMLCLQLLTLCAILYLAGAQFRQVGVSSQWRREYAVRACRGGEGRED